VVSAVERVASCKIMKGVDISYGIDLDWILASTPEQCCQFCVENPKCVGWTHNVAPPRCYLKATSKLEPGFDDTTTAGILVENSIVTPEFTEIMSLLGLK